MISQNDIAKAEGAMEPDVRIAILEALRKNAPNRSYPGRHHYGYHLAVIAVCDAINDHAHPDEIWSAGVEAEDLTPSHRIGEHLAATRRAFGFIS